MKDKRMKEVLDRIAQRSIPDTTNLWPGIAARLEREPSMTLLRRRPYATILLALLLVLVLSGVVYALGRSLGYIPGIGLVDQSVPIRVLAEPVSQTRDGITVTVNEAVLTSSKTMIVFIVENIPQEHLSRDMAVPGCGTNTADRTKLQLPDDTDVGPLGAESGGWGVGYKATYTFAPLAADVKEAILVIPCIEGALPGSLPENWKLSLHFIPAPPEMTIVPVTEVTPAQETSNTGPLTLERSVETDRGYLLVGTFNSNGLPEGAQAMDFSTYPVMTDANGQNVLYDFANSQLEVPAVRPPVGSFPWAFEVIGKQHAWPLTIAVSAVAAQYPQEQAWFEFDAGTNPQMGQVWTLNQDLQLVNVPVRVLRAYRTADGYGFDFESNTFFHGVSLWIGNSLPGPTGMQDPRHFSAMVRFEGAIPDGKLEVLVSNPVLAISGTWQIQWQPETTSTEASPTQIGSTPVCLTSDSWKAALANPQPLPAELSSGRLLAYGPLSDDYLNYDNYGSFIINMDGSIKRTVNRSTYPSLSPDLHYLAFGGEDGLYLIDLTNGSQALIPNTTPADGIPLWSPDGTRIAFWRSDDLDLYVINPDGSHLRRVINKNGDEQLVGWTADGTGLYYGVNAEGGLALRKLDIASGAIDDLFIILNRRAFEDIDLSPDGNRIAFHARENLSDAIYLSNLDGSNRRLVAQMGKWVVTAPFWLPGGEWLAVVILPTDLPDQPSELALVNVQDCRIIPLSWRAQAVFGWIP